MLDSVVARYYGGMVRGEIPRREKIIFAFRETPSVASLLLLFYRTVYMALVSSIYGLAPSDGYPTKDEQERRLKAKVWRLVEAHGQDTVLRRIRAWPVAKEAEPMKAWLVLTVYATEHRRASS